MYSISGFQPFLYHDPLLQQPLQPFFLVRKTFSK